MKKFLLFLFVFFTVFRGHAFAQDNFSTSYKVIYNVSENGVTQVTSNVSIKNDSSDYFISKYSIKTGFNNVQNVRITDSGGNVKYSLTRDSSGNQISFTFNNNVVGIGKSQNFTVYYETPDIAKAQGNVWEINIPGFAGQETYSDFSAEVKVPQGFGVPSIIKPQAPDIKKINQDDLIFSKSDLGSSGISIYFGSDQIYQFNLKYHLYNKNLLPVTSEIAIPSNNNYQDVQISDISPKPTNVYVDKNGNWLAQFTLSPNSTKEIAVTGKARIYSTPKTQAISGEEKQLFTKPDQYWESNNPNISTLAKELKTPRAIFDYVVSNLKYDPNRVTGNQVRAGAAGVLANKSSAVCLEFTDLFIALSRAAGIPAREVEGFANTDNSASRPLSLSEDVLHAWPEYYDFQRKAWIMVDPTWENTTHGIDYFDQFDFDHFAFVINGDSSTYPVPAGGYKLPGHEDSKDVDVTETTDFENITPSIDAGTKISNSYLAGLPLTGSVIISNNSGVVSPPQTLELSASDQDPSPQYLYFDSIPPFGNRTVAFRFSSKPILTNEADTVKIRIGKEVIFKDITISPFYKSIYFYLIGGILIGSLTVALFAIARKSRRLPIS